MECIRCKSYIKVIATVCCKCHNKHANIKNHFQIIIIIIIIIATCSTTFIYRTNAMFYCNQTAGMLMTACIIYSVKTHKFLVYLRVVNNLIITLLYDCKLCNFL